MTSRAGTARTARSACYLVALLLAAGPAGAVSVNVYGDWAGYTAAAPGQRTLDFSGYSGGTTLSTQLATTQYVTFTQGQKFSQYGNYFSNTALPWVNTDLVWYRDSANNLLPTSLTLSTGGYDPTHIHFVAPDGVTPIGVTSFWVDEWEPGNDFKIALFDQNDATLYERNQNTRGAGGVGLVSDTPFYSVFFAPLASTGIKWISPSYAVGTPLSVDLDGGNGAGTDYLNGVTIDFLSVNTIGATSLSRTDTLPAELDLSGYSYLPSFWQVTNGNVYSTVLGYDISIRYDEAALPSGLSEADLKLYHVDASNQIQDWTTTLDAATNTIRGHGTSFSGFFLGGEAPPVPEPSMWALLLAAAALRIVTRAAAARARLVQGHWN